jgi:hypothetical protein
MVVRSCTLLLYGHEKGHVRRWTWPLTWWAILCPGVCPGRGVGLRWFAALCRSAARKIVSHS